MPEIQPSEPMKRQDELAQIFLDAAGGNPVPQPETIDYFRDGGSMRLLLGELNGLLPPSEHETEVTEAREEYLNVVLSRPAIGRRGEWQQTCATSRDTYKGLVVAGLQQVIDAHTPEEMLKARQLPSIISSASFEDGTDIDLPTFAANHLYLLVDTALREHVARRNFIDEYNQEKRLSRVVNNRPLRLALAAGVFAASISPELHFIPLGAGQVANDVQVGLEVMSAALFGWEAPEEIRWRYLDVVHARRTHQLHDQLASSRELADLALRITYNASHYGSHGGTVAIRGHGGSDDRSQNLQAFRRLDEEFRHFTNDPGGKPYTGNQALGYAARLLVERRPELDAVISPNKTAAEQEALYLKLADDILGEDLARMEKGLSSSHLRRLIMRTVGIVPAVLTPHALRTVSDATENSLHFSAIHKHQEE